MITNKFLCFCAALCALPHLASASTITTGTPNFFGAGLSPTFGTLVNFDSLTPMSTVSSGAFTSVGIQSIVNNPGTVPLIALPFSQQSPPNELSTGVADNYAGDITITFGGLSNEVGVGIAEDGTTPTTLTVLGTSGNVLGSFVETVPSTTFNAYYVISDPTFDINALEINASQNLAIDDVQFTLVPEPASLLLAAVGLTLLAGFRRRKSH